MLFEKVRDILAEQLEIDPETITLDTNIVDDLDADSLDFVEMITSIEDEFNIVVTDEKVGDKVTFRIVVDGENLTYQWYLSKDGGETWTKSSSTTAVATCTLSSASRNGWLYRCVVTDGDGNSVVSDAARVIVQK